jgi:crossover junction endodeoxyribonuclease RusA
MHLRVVGRPAPQGSKRHVGKGIMVESSKHVKPWRSDVRDAALKWREENGEPALLDGPLEVSMLFVMARPKSRKKDVYVTTAPDISKLIRSTEDALTGVVWTDDARVVRYVDTEKRYAVEDELPGLVLTVKSA